MDTLYKARAKEKGYHLRGFTDEARRLAKAGAAIANVPIGEWVAQAVREKFERDQRGRADNGRDDDGQPG